MIVYGYIAWFTPVFIARDIDGHVIRGEDNEPIRFRKVGIIAESQTEDGSIVTERFVSTAHLDFSDEELNEWQDKKVMREIELHFDMRQSKKGGVWFQNCELLDVKTMDMDIEN